MCRFSPIFALCLTVLIAPALGGCQELQSDPNAGGGGSVDDEVIVDWNSAADFTAYETFAFVDTPADQEGAPPYIGINEGRLRDAIRAEFAGLGISESEDPDLEIVYLAYSEEASEVSIDCVPAVYWYGYSGGYDSCAFIEVQKTNFEIGTVILGFGDVGASQIVFQAIAQGIADGNNVEARIQAIVAEVFEQYPAEQTGA